MTLRSKMILAATAFVAHSSFATQPCPPEAREHCGPNPFYVLMASLADTCMRFHPTHAQVYKVQLQKFRAANPYDYARLHTDAQFVEALNEAKRKLGSVNANELHEACRDLRDNPPQ